MSAEQLAGPKRQGRRADDIRALWHGSQPGRVTLSERLGCAWKSRVCARRRRGRGSAARVAIPAYDAMQRDQRLADRMLAIMERRLDPALRDGPAGDGRAGRHRPRRSPVRPSRPGRESSRTWLSDFSKVDVLIIYLDDAFGNHHLAAVGVDEDGKNRLGVRSGASENATVTTALLEDLVARGIRPDRRRLFVVDGAQGATQRDRPGVRRRQRGTALRNHKLRNVVGHLPNAQHDQARATLWKLEAKEGCASLTSTPRDCSNATGPCSSERSRRPR